MDSTNAIGAAPDEREFAADREALLPLLKRHGWNATSFQVLEPGFRYWWDGPDACIGYVDTGAAWVTAGAPFADPARFPELMARFGQAAQKQGRRIACVGTEPRFHEAVGWPALRIGDQPIWDPVDWLPTLARSRTLREQLRRARAKGVSVRRLAIEELDPHHPVRGQVERLIGRWLQSHPLAPMGFLVQVDPFILPGEHCYLVAERGGIVVGFLGIVPVYARHGWFFEDLLRDPVAPNGTTELLVDAGMREAVAEGVRLVTLGTVPLSGEATGWQAVVRRAGRVLYDFDGLKAFKAKLSPRSWDPIYLAHPAGSSPFLALYDTLDAFAKGGLVRFGLETLVRGPAVVMLLMAAFLVPWTILLALPLATRFFPSAAWQWAWVLFDVVLFLGLFQLSRRWRQGLADLLIGAVTFDAIATPLQVVLYDLPRRRTTLDGVIMAIAVTAPAMASIVLWNARARHGVLRADPW